MRLWVRPLRRNILIPRLRRLPEFYLLRAASSTCSRQLPGRRTRYSRQGSSTRSSSRPTLPHCRRCQGQASLGQAPCRRHRQGSGSRSPRQDFFLHPDSSRCSAQGGEICSDDGTLQQLPAPSGGLVTFYGRKVAMVRSVQWVVRRSCLEDDGTAGYNFGHCCLLLV
jgi:hypothetical protein